MKKFRDTRVIVAFAIAALLVFLLLEERQSFARYPAQQPNTIGQLVLETTTNGKRNEVYASATSIGGASPGFGPGIFITCNSIPIVDTRNGRSHPNAGSFITVMDSSYHWSYEGPDTMFEVEIPAAGAPVIADSFAGKTVYLADSLILAYTPTAPCSYLQLILGDEFQDSIRPVTPCDTGTGAMYPTWIGSLGLQTGAGTIAVARIKWIAFSSPSIRSILVEDSAVSKPVDVIWQ